MIENIKRELENLAHTLNDLESSIHSSRISIKGFTDLADRVENRMDILKTRIDFLTKEIGRIDDEKNT